VSEFELDYLILGGGAVGCIFGGLLSNSGHNVQIINRSLKTVDSIKTNGLHLDLNGKKINCFPKAGQPGDAMTARVVMVFTKTYQTKDALLGILPKMNSKTTYFSLQNGLGNGKVLSDITHSNSIFHGVTMLPATLLKAGHVKSKGVNTTWFGSYKSAEHNIANSILHDLIKCDFDVRLVENPNVHIWQKACFNIALNAISALINGSPGLVGDFPGVKSIVYELAAEAIEVATQDGIKIETKTVYEMIDFVCTNHRYHKPSMLQDIQLERATEIESLNGFIVQRAKQLNIKAPTNQMITELIKARENAGNFWKNSE
jgi:2-dehydropantoate 2-reductase|tara:strand:- start:47 stop:994 length:948 start_codon:yes stop_codon:yes gene_type:complete